MPSVFLAGLTVLGFGVATLAAGRRTGVLAGVVVGIAFVLLGGLFAMGGVIA